MSKSSKQIVALLILMMSSLTSAFILLPFFFTVALHESDTRTTLYWPFNIYLSNQCSLTPQIESGQDKTQPFVFALIN